MSATPLNYTSVPDMEDRVIDLAAQRYGPLKAHYRRLNGTKEELMEWFQYTLKHVQGLGIEYDYVQYNFKTEDGSEWLDPEGDPLYTKGPELQEALADGYDRGWVFLRAKGFRVNRHMRSLTGAGATEPGVSMKKAMELWPTDRAYNEASRALGDLIHTVEVRYFIGALPASNGPKIVEVALWGTNYLKLKVETSPGNFSFWYWVDHASCWSGTTPPLDPRTAQRLLYTFVQEHGFSRPRMAFEHLSENGGVIAPLYCPTFWEHLES